MARNIKNPTEKSIEPRKNPQLLNSTKHVCGKYLKIYLFVPSWHPQQLNLHLLKSEPSLD
jgi:hypothetical protein